MRPHPMSRSSLTMNSIWKLRSRRPTLRRTCKVYIPRDLRTLDTLRLPATYEEDNYLVQKLKTFTKHKIHHVILVVAIIVYLYTGALLFQYLEKECDKPGTADITVFREEFIDRIYNISLKPVHNNSNWFVEIRRAIVDHELKVLKINTSVNSSITGDNKGWSIETSFFYCFTVITTIGYGDISPCSDTGRAVTTFYALVGVPLMFLVLADLGKLFTKVMKFIYRHFKRFCKTGTFNINHSVSEDKPLQYMTVSWRTVRQEQKPTESKDDMATTKTSLDYFTHNQVTTLTIHNDDLYKNLDFMNPDEKNHKHVEVEDEFQLPVSLAVVMVAVYMVVGMCLFPLWENWTYFEAFYFVFISMTTIGLGDYTPQNEKYIMVGFMYLVLGLVLNSMCINVIQEKITATFQKAKVRIGNNTVLNVPALLEDEDHRSRAQRSTEFDINQKACCAFKITPHKDSISGMNSTPLVQTPKPFYKAIRKLSEGDIQFEASKNFLKVPLEKRFKFYDSPYSTIQDDNQITITSLRKF